MGGEKTEKKRGQTQNRDERGEDFLRKTGDLLTLGHGLPILEK